MKKNIGTGLLSLGAVRSGVAEILAGRVDSLTEQPGLPSTLKKCWCLKAVAARNESGAIIDSATDDAITDVRISAAIKEDIFGRPASADCSAGLIARAGRENFSNKRILCIVTGTGLKDARVAASYAQTPIELLAELTAVEESLEFPTSATPDCA